MTARTRSAIGLAGLCILLAACTSDGSSEPTRSSESSSPEESAATDGPSDAAAVPAAPKQGSCYRLTVQTAALPTSQASPVSCHKPHTSITIDVGRFDDLLAGHALGVDSSHVQRQVRQACPAELEQFVGGTAEDRKLSRFQVVWFTPTVAQADAGAHWFRCDLVAVAEEDRLLRLPGDRRLRGILDKPAALGTFGLCGTAQPGSRGFERVACALPHSWRAVSTIPLAGGSRYPGSKAVRAAGEDRCASEARAHQGLPLKFTYGWEWPTNQQWAAGQHYGFCWAPT